MRDELLLGIDLGTSSIKANAVDRHGRSLVNLTPEKTEQLKQLLKTYALL